MRHAAAMFLTLLFFIPARAEEDQAGDAGAERVLRLEVSDVGRLALRNNPELAALRLDPDIVGTGIQEAEAEFDTFLTGRTLFRRTREEVFFDPSAFASGGADSRFAQENTIAGGAGVNGKADWGGQWSFGYDADSVDRSGPGVSALSPRYGGLLSLGYVHPLLRGSGLDVNSLDIRAAEEQTRSSDLVLQRRAAEVVADAESAYWNLVGALDVVRIVKKSVQVALELREVAVARLESGSGIRVDVTQADAGVARRQTELITAENNARKLADRLRQLILPFQTEQGLDVTLRLVPANKPAPNPVPPEPLPGAEVFEETLPMRRDIQALNATIVSAELRARRADDALQSDLNATANGGLTGQGSGFNDSSSAQRHRDEYRWEVGVEWTVPLGNDLAEARSRRAHLTVRQLERDLVTLRNAAVREIRDAYNDVESSERRIGSARRNVEAATEQLAAERARQESGRSTPFRVLEVEEDLVVAEGQEVEARIDYEKAHVALKLAIGQLLQSRDLDGLVTPADE